MTQMETDPDVSKLRDVLKSLRISVEQGQMTPKEACDYLGSVADSLVRLRERKK